LATSEAVFPLVPRRRLIGLSFGAMHSARRGTGSDVAGSRPYMPGDDVDAIDWNASARLSSARDADEFIVRERFAEEAPRVVVVCDRRPEMSLYPPALPWLSKPTALRHAVELIAESALQARGLIGYLDFGDVEHPDPRARDEPFWRAPRSEGGFWEVRERRLPDGSFHAPRDCTERALEHLVEVRRSVPPGSFVFVCSDFIEPPTTEAWLRALERRWDVVPVLIQDPVWEQTFPDVASVGVPLADPRTGKIRIVRLSAREARDRRTANEERLARTLQELEALGLEPVVIGSHDREQIFQCFLGWSEGRTYRRMLGR